MLKRLWPLFISLTVFQAIFASELHDAVKNGDEKKMRELLDSGKAHVNDKDDLGRTPLHWASMNKEDLLFSALLMGYGANSRLRDNNGSLPSHLAASNGNRMILGLLLRHSAEINAEANSEEMPQNESLDFYAYPAPKHIMPYYCAEVDARDGQGRTHLYLLAHYNRKEIIEFLLDFGPNKNLEDNDGNTPLEIALEKGHWEIVDALRTYKSKYNSCN